MSVIKFGMWGFGHMGRLHVSFHAMKNNKFELTAVCDTEKSCCETAEKDFDVKAYPDLEAFLVNQEMELVVIFTLSIDHTRMPLKLLKPENTF